MARERDDDGDDRLLVEWAFRQASVSLSVFDLTQSYLRLNDTASEVMGIPEDALRGRFYLDTVPEDDTSLGFLRSLREVARTGQPIRYQSHTRAPSGLREHAWSLEMWPVRDPQGRLCAVALAAFDSSEQHWARQRLAVLDRAAVRVGTTLDVTRTAEELTQLAVPMFADFASVDLLEEVLRGEEPPPGLTNGSLALRRVAHLSAIEGNPQAAITLGAADEYPPYSPPARALRTGRPVLSATGERDFDRWIGGVPARAARAREFGSSSVLAVPLIARGTTLGVVVLFRSRPDRFTIDDLTLAKEVGGRAALSVDNARRYTHERATALALQESLLPHGPSRYSAVETASRYLPADSRAGIGGDWFDVIPLSGARVAVVVGDVVGHGLHASAAMGRLRTAVRTLADVDLPPDELLAHLDDLVLRLGSEDENSAEICATCLYAVYDPVSRRCTFASAGHPSPVIVLPDGTTELPAINAGPVLGIGGLPFEATELELPEGSLLALFSDGLVESGRRDVDEGVAELCRVLAAPAPSLESACDRVLEELHTGSSVDDVALLLVRTRALPAERVATWDLPSDPAHVATARRLAAEQLTAWGLDEAAFVTELVVSELVTNAIRYGLPPVQLRLIHDEALICEVSDGNSTAPHMRRARTFDEGGRGLLLVAQLTQRWGTRHHPTGKTIWTAQALSRAAP
ncbi:SpoIIE family protein phosphatase [Streptacidiphilus jiangxiensis]|uniref:Serine phosphatase RsbU, regulator of sigma subunit n=1 Tax=Streptacidiphilus jiangxiensis TaxID=235985 RepID=A0A1H7MYE8_STRJI|nr:SpoIIE family protein phosphatase [Streptacidiphilus jiangxiensis]SEL16101.1 Serine phosphatase RsbU, regulator of sigma subunit [Streptacidiphilus jiangxiensis]